MKICATSDLHLGHTNAVSIKAMSNDVRRENPDLFLVLGDIADGRRNFFECMKILANIGASRIATPGNHDLYDYHRDGSRFLYTRELPRLADLTGFHFGNQMQVYNDVTVIVTPGWCSGEFNSNGFSKYDIEQSYYTYMSDGRMIDIPYKELHREQLAWFEFAIKSATTPKLVIGSHYPLFNELYEPLVIPRPSDAYFYSPEFGEIIKAHKDRFEKIITIAGHVHRGAYKQFDNIECYIIPSGYHNPNFITIEV